MDGGVFLYFFKDWQQVKLGINGKTCWDVDVSDDENVVLAASVDCKVWVWFRDLEKVSWFDGHSGPVRAVKFIDGDLRVVSIADDKKVKIWKISKPDPEIILYQEDNFNILKLWTSSTSNQLKGIYDSQNTSKCRNCPQICPVHRETFYVSFDKQGTKTIISQLSSKFQVFCDISNELDEIIYVHQANDKIVNDNHGDEEIKNSFFCVLSQGSGSVIRSSVLPIGVLTISLSTTGKFIAVGEWFKFSLVRYENLELIQTIYAMHGAVLSVAIDSQDSFIYIGSSNVLKKYRFDIGRTFDSIEEVDRKVYETAPNSENCKTTLTFTQDFQYLLCLFPTLFELIHVETLSPIMRIAQAYSGVLFNLNHTIFLYGENTTDIFSGRSFQKMSTIIKSFNIQSAILSKSQKYIYYLTQNRILKAENPLKPSKLTLVGDITKLQSFQSHVDRVFSKSEENPYLESLWIIEPVHVNLLHIYAYCNLSEILAKAIKGNGIVRVPVINSRDGFSALTVAIEKRFLDCVEAVVKTIRKIIKEDESLLRLWMLQVIEENLIDLTTISYSSLHKLFYDIYSIDLSNYLPDFCPPKVKLPVLLKSDNFFLKSNEFGFDIDEHSIHSSSVIYKKSFMRLYLEIGSSKSLEFMKALEVCENSEIYDTPLVKQILEEKWRQVRWIMYSQSILYVTYLILLSLYTSSKPFRLKSFLVAPFSITCLLYTYELIFVILGPREYFSNFWNIIDTIRALIMIIYTILVWAEHFQISFDKNEKERFMLAILLFISWTRGITYFRINAATRYLIKLLFQVCLDIIPFLIILFYSTVAFALMFRAFDSDINSDFFPYLTDSYNIILGGWENPHEPKFYSLILFLATLLNPIVSLNLLIAILTDTFETVKNDEVEADSQELAAMIVEVETLIFWNREKNLKKFIHLIEKDRADAEDEPEIEALVKNVRSKLNDLADGLKYHNSSLTKFKSKVEEISKTVNVELSNLKNR